MELTSYGNSERPAVFLIPGGNLSAQALYAAAKPLERRYFLVLFCPDAALSPEERAKELEKCIREDFCGRIWAAYGLAEGGEALLELLRLDTVRIRTVVVENCPAGPESAALADTPATLHCWVNGRDRAAKKYVEKLKKEIPSLHILTLKKLKSGMCFAERRGDLMCKRLEKAFGAARTVRVSSLMPASVGEIWDRLPLRPVPRAAGRLTETDTVVADREKGVYITGGHGGKVRLWSHLVRLEGVT